MPDTPYQTALDRIRQAADSGAEYLDLSKLGLISLPPEIGQLTNLTQLDLAGNQLTSLPIEIGQLISLTRLIIADNKLIELPAEIGQITNLAHLNLSNNQLTNLSPELWKLTELITLFISDNPLSGVPVELWQRTDWTALGLNSLNITSLPTEIGQLTNLRSLDLSDNQLTNLPTALWELPKLKNLLISGNPLLGLPAELWQKTDWERLGLSSLKLVSVPSKVSQFTNLKILDLSDNQLTSLPPEIGQLVNLENFYLYKNQLTSLPNEIGQLTKLISLSVWDNQLTNLPTEVAQLTSLATLKLFGNQLASLSKEIIELHNLEEIELQDNPLEISIPAKWLGRGNYAQEILAHYKRIYEGSGRELGEVRVLVVGEGGVGKTSIVKRLIGSAFDDKEDTTLIVEKRPLPLGDVRAQVWDFGGQEHMHATHQFFFSGRSLYLLVFDTRGSLEQNKVEYWLTLINAYSQNAPVILVGNKCDQHEMDIEKRRLREKYPNIRGFVGTSASTGEHIAELHQKIQEEVRAMPQVRVLFSADYLAVKDEMETLSAAHISHEEFVRVCERHGVSDEQDQDTLLDLLHDLGTVLYFRDADGNPLLPALGVLNPNWVTGGVYRIVTNPALKDKHKGRLTMSLLREILSMPEYSRHCEDIAKLLERFELCYRADDSSYWLPSLMEKDGPAALSDFTSAMKFEYWYPELPKSVIVRFIVKTHKMILENQVWRYGVVLKLDGNTAFVRADERDKRVSIFIAGEESTCRDALAILRAHFDDIHAMFATPPESFIYPPQYPDLRLPFADMKTLAKTEREHKAVYQGKPVTINIRELLDGFVTADEMRKDKEEEEKEFGRRGGDTYITNFNVGGNMESSNVAIGKEHQITQTISNTFPHDLQAALVKFIQDYQSELEKVEDAEQKEELQEELDTLKKDVAKKQPNKERIKVTVEGLKKAAENIKGITLPVLETAAKVILFLKALP